MRILPKRVRKLTERPLAENEYHVYLAGPFFNIGQTWLVEESRLALQAMGLKVFSPCHDVGIGGAHEVAPKDLDALRQSRSVFALVDGLYAGTIFEIGYARARDIPVVALAQSTADEPLKMILGSGCDIRSHKTLGEMIVLSQDKSRAPMGRLSWKEIPRGVPNGHHVSLSEGFKSSSQVFRTGQDFDLVNDL